MYQAIRRPVMLACAIAAGLLALPATAVDIDSPLYRGFYGFPAVTYTNPDNDRRLDEGIGGSLGLGFRFSPLLGIELSANTADLDRTDGNGQSALEGATASVLLFPSKSLRGIFVTFGVGTLESDNDGAMGSTFEGEAFEAGLGYMQALSFGRYDFAVRGDWRARHNNNDSGANANRDNVVDNYASLGLVLPFGLAEPPPEPPKTDAVDVVEAKYACEDGLDNDRDGKIDFPDDSGCESADDGDETNLPQCNDGIDNDGDGAADFPEDKGCETLADNTEDTQCDDPNPGEIVSLHGCGTGDVVTLIGVNFELDEAELEINARRILNFVAAELIKYPSIELELGGHTDATGSEAYNQDLSQRRADAVKDYLVSKGVDAGRLTAKGYGESKPVADNGTAAGRAENRRTELTITAGTAQRPSSSN